MSADSSVLGNAGPAQRSAGPAVAARVYEAQVALLYQNTPASLAFSLVAAALVCWLLAEVTPAPVLAGWFALAIVLNAVRYGLMRVHARESAILSQPRTSAQFFIMGAFLNGAFWGVCGTVLLPRGHPALEFALVAILGVILGIAYSSLTAMRAAYMAFVCPFIVPIAAVLLYRGSTSESIIGVAALVYLAVVWVIGKRCEVAVVDSFTRQFENEDLLARIREAHARAERVSYDLALEVAERQRTQAQLVLAKEAAERANEAKSAFLATMSHEIRTPMNGVLGMNELLLGSELNPQQRVWAEAGRASSRHLLAVINDILDFSKIDAGQLEIERVDFDLHEVVEEALAMFVQEAQTKGVGLSSDFVPHHAVLSLRGDPFRLRQVIANLVGNAVKFTNRGGEVVVRVIEKERTPKEIAFSVSVEDTGVGIAEDAQAGIFEQFAQADGSTTRVYGGSGLGLTICRRLLDLMGGHISVQSTPGKGSTFVIDLRLPVASAIVHRAAPKQPDRKLHGTVLLVEDNAVNQDVGKAMLSKLGLECQVANDGAQALDRVRGFEFDLVLMDCQMPVMDGFEAATRIRQLPDGRGAKLPIIALTASVMQGIEQKCLDAGMNALLAKPYRLTSLRSMLARWLSAPAIDTQAAAAPPVDNSFVPAASARPAAIDLAVMENLREIDETGSTRLARELFGTFLDLADRGLAQVRDAIDADNAEALRREAHGLKSSAANVGALILSGCYRDLEMLAREGRIDDARAMMELVQREHERAVSQLLILRKELA